MFSSFAVLQDHSPHNSIGLRMILRDCFASSQSCVGGSCYSNLSELSRACLEDGGKVERKSVKAYLLKKHGYAYPKTNLEGLALWL